MTTTKKCPMCAETIPLAASTCEYCGAQFEVTITGYCTNCHQVRDADLQGCCRVCSSEIVDLRIDSRLVEQSSEQISEPVQANVPASPAVKKTWAWILGVVIVLGVVALAFGLMPKLAPVIPPSTATATLTATLVPVPTSTNGPLPTRTPLPTSTSTPQPEWVTDFAQPILDAIALRAPDFQDDFDDKSGGWRQPEKNPCGQRIEIRDGELVLTDCRAHPANIDYADFVAEFDARFLPDTSRRSEWEIFFRLHDTSYTYFGVNYDGSAAIGNLSKIGEKLEFPSVAKPGLETNHLLVIAKGSKFAFYMNNQPFHYLESPSVFRQGDIWLANYDGSGSVDLAHPAIVAFDNFKIWNIDDLP